MNTSNQAQKGFKTFILTLSVSLILFSAVYYFISGSQTTKEDVPSAAGEERQVEVTSPKFESRVETNAFKQLAEASLADIGVRTASGGVVLSGSTTTEVTQSTASVPDTGTFGMTMGLFSGLTLFVFALFLVRRNPTRMAMEGFEREVLRSIRS